MGSFIFHGGLYAGGLGSKTVFAFKERMCRMTEWVLELTLRDGRLSPKSVGLPLSRGTALDLPVCTLH